MKRIEVEKKYQAGLEREFMMGRCLIAERIQ
jgi:hypothetical protein